ncbi:MAG: transposase, partial [Nitrososphaerales archaeon]
MFTAQQEIEIVLAGVRSDRSIKEVCREHEIAETLYNWRDKLLEGGKSALAGKEERTGEKQLKRKIRELERVLGRQRPICLASPRTPLRRQLTPAPRSRGGRRAWTFVRLHFYAERRQPPIGARGLAPQKIWVPN